MFSARQNVSCESVRNTYSVVARVAACVAARGPGVRMFAALPERLRGPSFQPHRTRTIRRRPTSELLMKLTLLRWLAGELHQRFADASDLFGGGGEEAVSAIVGGVELCDVFVVHTNCARSGQPEIAVIRTNRVQH